MNRRDFLKKSVVLVERFTLSSFALAAGYPLSGKPARARTGQKPPNIVFIFIDDMGWRDVGFMGSRYYETPNIDKLAGRGMVFTNAYSNAPNCAPARACLLSGQYTPRHGVYTVSNSDRGPSRLRKLIPVENTTDLDTKIVTIAEAIKPAGYVSASIGKWHLGTGPEVGPTGQGFDVNVGGFSAGHPPKVTLSPTAIPSFRMDRRANTSRTVSRMRH